MKTPKHHRLHHRHLWRAGRVARGEVKPHKLLVAGGGGLSGTYVALRWLFGNFHFRQMSAQENSKEKLEAINSFR